MPRNQRSVQREGMLKGIALHSGAEVSVRVRPAPPDTGVVFVRVDLPGSPRIRADAEHLSVRERRTALVGQDGAEVHTVEHFLACCTGLRVDNLVVEVTAAELPGMDGSAKPYVDLLRGLGIVEQKAQRREIVVDEPVAVAAGQDVSLVAFPNAEGFKVSYTLDYRPRFPGVQHVSFVLTEDAFAEDIAPARTFVLEHEAAALRKAGLGQGASHENTLVVGETGVIGNTPRWPDEFARHKVLDLLGDLFLAGADLVGHVHAHRTGHAANLKLVERIVEVVRQRETEGRLRRPSGLDHVQIRKILPHRYPMLMVDRVVEIEGFRRAVGVKNVTVNEPYFLGHYPEQAIMPGVMIVEAMAQLGGLLLLRKLELTGRLPVLLSIDRVKFRRAVVPGDQLRLEAETLRLSDGRGRVQCKALVQGVLAAEARLNFAVSEDGRARALEPR
jgi:UDP-3-O-[3-hydroxymyristoyl] N-acetylglucosamine deacetylase/3-hydroxyacyl-[acyl-carrier-protein] dehydratase